MRLRETSKEFELASEFCVIESNLNKLEVEVSALRARIDAVNMDRQRVVDELLKCVGRNIPQKYFVIHADIVIVDSNNGGVIIKKAILE